MTAFRGLFTRPDSTRGTSPVEARKSLAGLFHRLASGAPRQGLLTALTVAGTSGWSYSVPAAQWVTSRGAVDGVVLAGNDGTVSVATSAAPATGSRIDIIYVLNRDVDNADADSEALIGVAQGAASGTPVAPSIPAGAMEIARATVLATNTSTSQASISQTAPITGLAGADLVVSFGLSSFTARIPSPVAGMRVFSTADNALYVRAGASWSMLWSDSGWQTLAPGSGWATVSPIQIRAVGPHVRMRGEVYAGATGTTVAVVPVEMRPSDRMSWPTMRPSSNSSVLFNAVLADGELALGGTIPTSTPGVSLVAIGWMRG